MEAVIPLKAVPWVEEIALPVVKPVDFDFSIAIRGRRGCFRDVANDYSKQASNE